MMRQQNSNLYLCNLQNTAVQILHNRRDLKINQHKNSKYKPKNKRLIETKRTKFTSW